MGIWLFDFGYVGLHVFFRRCPQRVMRLEYLLRYRLTRGQTTIKVRWIFLLFWLFVISVFRVGIGRMNCRLGKDILSCSRTIRFYLCGNFPYTGGLFHAIFCCRRIQRHWLGGQRIADALGDEIMYQTRLLETHFMFGGMHVHINIIGIKINKQHKSRVLLVG